MRLRSADILFALLVSIPFLFFVLCKFSNKFLSSPEMAGTEALVRVQFEVFGKVQGVFFRKYTQEQGQTLGLRGFCRNTRKGTVSGTMEGPQKKVEQMKDWLRRVGSPSSRIERADFSPETPITEYSFKGGFGVERTI